MSYIGWALYGAGIALWVTTDEDLWFIFAIAMLPLAFDDD